MHKMVLRICEYCGNEQEFKCSFSRTHSGDVYFKGDEDPDLGDFQNDDYDDYDYGDIMCDECESDCVKEIDDEDALEEYKCKHTDNNNNWSYEELPEDKRNKEMVKKLNLRKL